jgi:hypothetical protein
MVHILPLQYVLNIDTKVQPLTAFARAKTGGTIFQCIGTLSEDFTETSRRMPWLIAVFQSPFDLL